jgi:polyisoprenyl-phosphate glycosyltransferase
MNAWVVCPSYRDVASFTILRLRIQECLDKAALLNPLTVRMVLVDDTGGLDPEIAQLSECSDVLVITPPFNLGHQRAIVFGLRKLLPRLHDRDVIVTMDADGEDQPEDLLRLLAPLLDAPDALGALCVARRTERKESLQFKVMYVMFRAMFRTMTGTTVRSGNFAAYRGWLAQRILLHPYFDLCYSSSLVSLGVDVIAVPCARGSRYAGRSRMSMFRLFMHGVRMLMPFTDRIAVRALAAFSALFGLGIVLAAVVVGIRLFTPAAIPGWTTFTVLGLLILSVVALGNFLVLFAVISHSRGVSLANVEEWNDRSPGSAPVSPD